MGSVLKNLFCKFFSFFFGKTNIFSIVLGWFLVITGTLFLVNPQKVRNALLNQSFGFIKSPLLLLTIFLVMFFISLFGKTSSVFLKILLIVTSVLVIKLLLSLKQKSYNVLTEKLAKIPI